MSKTSVFIGYGSAPAQIGTTIEDAVKLLKKHASGRTYETWREVDIPGRFIIDGILDKINQSSFVVMDTTRLNFNVCFEVGYSIGAEKRCIVTLNAALDPPTKEINRLGIFDTLGYHQYSNSNELSTKISKVESLDPANFPMMEQDTKNPVFLLDTHFKTDATARTRTRLARAKISFREFDPRETARLSALDAYKGVSASIGVVVQLLSSHATDYQFNNYRAAFVAGMAMGMGRELLMLQDGDEPVPLDYRDLVATYRIPSDVDKHIAAFATRIMAGLQAPKPTAKKPEKDFLATLDLGSPAAENEASNLNRYYVQTDNYKRAQSGDVRLVVGRKGSGKTALFLQLGDRVAAGRDAVVLNLKPEGYQLKKFKEQVLRALSDGSKEHVVTAFWEAVLLVEVAQCVLEKDAGDHIRNHRLFEPYKRLQAAIPQDSMIGEGDFSERLTRTVDRIIRDFPVTS